MIYSLRLIVTKVIGLSMHFELVRYMYISKPETFTALEIENHKTDIEEYKLGLH